MAGWLARTLGIAKTDGPRRNAAGRRRKRLRFEQLEQRRLLTADLGAIAGAAFTDLDGDGLFEPAAGETGISGVQVSLEGSGAMGPVAMSMVTGADGSYRFDGLTAGSYTVKQLPPAPVGVLPSSAGQEFMITITPEQAMGSLGQSIDTFTEGEQIITAIAPGPGNPAFGSVNTAGALGGTRDLFVDVTSATGIATMTTNVTYLPGVLDINPGPSAFARYVVTWDGDNDPMTLDADGLIGSNIDLTEGGMKDGLLLRLGVDKSDQEMKIRVYSDDANFSEAVVMLPNTGGMPSEEIYLPWSDFAPAAGLGADLSQVGAIQLDIDAMVNAMDGQISLIATRGPSVLVADLPNIPAAAAIDIEKSTNGIDADTGVGPLVAQGGDVVFDYVVRNLGNTTLGTVQVIDDNGTPGDMSDDFSPTFVAGDLNNNSLLDLDEVWTYQASATASLGAYMNLGKVSANPVSTSGVDIAGVDDVMDSDASHHFAVAASIDIEKSTNGEDADAGTGPIVQTGSTVRFEYVVRNQGNTSLSNVIVVDDNGTPSVGDDFAPTFVSGDVDADGRLDPDEAWIYEATATAAVGDYVNVGRVTANPVTTNGEDISVLNDVMDQDPSRHFAMMASIDIEKATNGEDADTPEGPLVPVGDAVEFTYVVTNTGNVALGDVQVSDDTMTGLSFVGGDIDGDDLLDVDEVWTFTISTTSTAGQHVCTGTVTANPVFEGGQDIPTVSLVNDADPSHYFGVTSVINVEKSTNGEDADTGTGPTIPVGAAVTFQFIVTNLGNQPLQNVTLWDDAGTPGDTSDDVQPTLVSGDTNNDGLLDPDEAWMYEWLTSAIAGQYENRAVAAADDVFGQSVTDDDLSHYLGLQPFSPQAIPPNVPNKRRFLSSTW